MKKGLFGMVVLVFLLAGCQGVSDEEGTQDIKEKVHQYSVDHFDNVTASITSHELIVTENNTENTYELPGEEFFVSIAPFINETHPCAIHSLTGCQGELTGKDFNVYIEDEEGSVIVDKTMTSLENGFIDLWLPRDKTYHVTIEYDGEVAEADISTFEGDDTCITTMQLL